MDAPRVAASATMSASTPTRSAPAMLRGSPNAKITKVGSGYRLCSSARLPVHRLLRPAEGHRAAEEPAHHSQGDAGRLHQESRISRTKRQETVPPEMTLYYQLSVHRAEVGHDHRHELLHRLQDLHRGLPGGEQHSRRRQGADDARPPDAVAAGGRVLRGRHGESRDVLPAGAVPAVRERALRSGLSGRAPRCTAPKA